MVPARDFFIRFLCFCERLLGKNGDEGIELILQQLQTCEGGRYCL
jgi:hypothetical protein